MCGIVGIFLKNKELHSQLGSLFSPMLTEMGDRGPDSSGFAIYRDEIEDELRLLYILHLKTSIGTKLKS